MHESLIYTSNQRQRLDMVVVREQKGDRVLQTAEELHKKMVTSSIFFVKVLTATSYEKKYCNLWNLLLFISNKVHLRLVLCYFSSLITCAQKKK